MSACRVSLCATIKTSTKEKQKENKMTTTLRELNKMMAVVDNLTTDDIVRVLTDKGYLSDLK